MSKIELNPRGKQTKSLCGVQVHSVVHAVSLLCTKIQQRNKGLFFQRGVRGETLKVCVAVFVCCLLNKSHHVDADGVINLYSCSIAP